MVPKLFLGEKPQIRSLIFEELDETDHDLDASALRSQLIPPHLNYESMGLFRIDSIKEWVQSESSGFLWMNGFVEGAYEWTVGFTVDLLRVARLYKYPTLHYFCAEHYGSEHSKYLLQPKATVHKFIFQLIEQYQDIFRSNPEVLNQSRFDDAIDSFTESWSIFTEALDLVRPPVLYIAIDNIDCIHPEGKPYRDGFISLVQGLQDLTERTSQTVIIFVAARAAREYPGISVGTARTKTRVTVVDVPPILGSSYLPPINQQASYTSWTPFLDEIDEPKPEPLGRVSTWEQIKAESKQHQKELELAQDRLR